MTAPKWLTPRMVRALHAEAVAVFGGAPGLRDPGLLDNALERPRNLYAFGEGASLFKLAAVTCAGIGRSRPFADGNKRAAVLAAQAFLDLNGYDFRPPEGEVVTVIEALAAGQLEQDALALWLSDFATRRRG